MDLTIRHLVAFFVHHGAFGLILLSIADDSFLFLPVGIDLLTVILVAQHPQKLVLYALAGAAGSAIGVLILDLVCRKGGKEGLKRIVRPRLLAYLNQRMEKQAAMVLVVACLAPPPFPFGAAIAVASALQYPRARLLTVVFFARAVRFLLVGWAAVYFGRDILRMAKSTGFEWFMGIFIAICMIGSAIELFRWVRAGRSA